MKEEQHPIPDDIKVPNINDVMLLTSAISADSERKMSVVNSEVITSERWKNARKPKEETLIFKGRVQEEV